jgi:two-component system C4-dicarboxylate transport sensor histidine kinase DctB
LKAPRDERSRVLARFARAVIALYVASALLGGTVLAVALGTDKVHDENVKTRELLLETTVRAYHLGVRLASLLGELERLAERGELRSELEGAAHSDSSLRNPSAAFNVGVALLDASGAVLASEPGSFVPVGSQVRAAQDVLAAGAPRLVAVDPEAGHALVYVMVPVIRDGRVSGIVLGGADLTAWSREPESGGVALVVTRSGEVVVPARPPEYTTSPQWRAMFDGATDQPDIRTLELRGTSSVIASAPLEIGPFRAITVADEARLLADTRARFWFRLALGMGFFLLPLLVVTVWFRRDLARFAQAEEEAVRAERLRTMGEAANLIAHEVRNSLNGIRMGLDLMLRGQGGQKVVTETRAEIERLTGFTHQLMIFSKGPSPQRGRVDLASLVESTLQVTREVAQELRCRIDLHLEPGLMVAADPTLIRIVVGNLVSNAVDALGAREGDDGVLVVRVERHDANAVVRVSDNGPGVPPELADTLFEPFVTGKPSGVGLGLALARRIARAHQGDLTLEPRADGATFVLRLPLEVPA